MSETLTPKERDPRVKELLEMAANMVVGAAHALGKPEDPPPEKLAGATAWLIFKWDQKYPGFREMVQACLALSNEHGGMH